jgi:anti-sigma factor RsiW
MSADTTHTWCLDRLSAFVDGELELADARQVEAHLGDCAECRSEHAALLQTIDTLHRQLPSLRAPEALRARVVAGLPRQQHVPVAPSPSAMPRAGRGVRTRQWLAAAAVVLLSATAYTLGRLDPSGRDASMQEAVVAAHVRSLQAGHLTDVVSTDEHTVKPWFTGKLDFSPIVQRFDSAGYTLVGGRLDYVNGHQAAALVYQRRRHLINVLVYPAGLSERGNPHLASVRGYQIVNWISDGMAYWVVSDLNGAELQSFCALLQRRSGAGG